MEKLRAVLVDLNGTLHVGDQVVGDAVAALQRLRASETPVRFVSNTSKESKQALLARVKRLGLDVREEELFTSLTAVRAEVDRRGLRNPLLLLSPSAREDFEARNLPEDQEHDGVVVGLAPDQMHYEALDRAFKALQRGTPLLAAHKGRYLATSDGGIKIGPGAFVSALEYASDTEAIVLGKPSRGFFMQALASFGIPDLALEEVAMIGDDVRDDALAAKEHGLLGVLARTGKYTSGDESKHSSAPDVVVDDFAHFVDLLLEARK
ncbi:Haloacid dehalogenase-like hydrolase domain-containing protein 2 [Hondaea fermentalgiana]|uniref:Haloacid dehalogenase-like hydrolase domain-containing protein 2 n=1 Tax=Hondaea fermentalgiana TaxID=2315210 RepID=A0A2R5GAS3_9STRA|nr:Haloacid dehalogenase-like hydrolase domain-containing protein 2 [Hondaea fermentalgiana]|eukprot:GBG24794.1 Haloacid dehalogenase-like hydrolase domain-containing protein 2 [Hondaea fermentalgiana]